MIHRSHATVRSSEAGKLASTPPLPSCVLRQLTRATHCSRPEPSRTVAEPHCPLFSSQSEACRPHACQRCHVNPYKATQTEVPAHQSLLLHARALSTAQPKPRKRHADARRRTSLRKSTKNKLSQLCTKTGRPRRTSQVTTRAALRRIQAVCPNQ